MTLHRIEHAVVMDTDDVPGRGGYAVVGISRGVLQAERAFIAGNFGISDYLHDPKTENRIFYSSFRIPGGRHAFVRRFARGNELRRNNTQRRVVVHTLLLEEDVWEALHALPWLLLNASVRVEGAQSWDRLRADVPWVGYGAELPPLEWDDGDGATSGVVTKLNSRLGVIGTQLAGRAPEPRELIARVLSGLGSQTRVALPQDPGYEWVTMLAWSMLPRHDRDELAWTQHDTMNLSGVAFPLANTSAADFDPMKVRPEPFAEELVQMNTESEDSWLDLQGRTSRDRLTVRSPGELAKWMKWRDALIDLRDNIRVSDAQVVAYMEKLAATAEANRNASWIDGEEVLRLIWSNVPAAIAKGQTAEHAIQAWGSRLQRSGLGDVIFRAAPNKRWLSRAAEEVGADPLVSFFLAGAGEGPGSKAARAAIAEWLTSARVRDVDGVRLATLSFLLAADRSPALHPLLELLLESQAGLDALLEYLLRRQMGGVELIHAAVPIVLRRAAGTAGSAGWPSLGHVRSLRGQLSAGQTPGPTSAAGRTGFLRDVFVPRFDPSRVDSALARDVASVLRDDPPTFLRFAEKVTPEIRTELMKLVLQWVSTDPQGTLELARQVLVSLQKQEGGIETGGPLALALADAGEPAHIWFDVLLRIARLTDAQRDANATRDFVSMMERLRERPLDLAGAMERLVALPDRENEWAHDSLRALILLLRPAWRAGGNSFARALRMLIERAASVTPWKGIVTAYAEDLGEARPEDVSDLAVAFWMKVSPAEMLPLDARTVALLDAVEGSGRNRLVSYWSQPARLHSLPSCAATDRLLELVHSGGSVSYQLEMDLASREIAQGKASARTLNRLDVAASRISGAKPPGIVPGIDQYLGDADAATRMHRLLKLFASDELLPSVRYMLQTRVLPNEVTGLKRRDFRELRDAVREEELLALGVVVRFAYAVGARANRSTVKKFERIWSAHRRRDALDALEAGRRTRGARQWLARMAGVGEPSLLAR